LGAGEGMEKHNNEEIIIRICCIIAAFTLWFYVINIENSTTYKIRNVTVHFLNEQALADSKLAILPNQQFTITLTVRGNASDLYSVTPDKFNAVADLSTWVVKKGENHIPVEIKGYPPTVNVVSENWWVKVNLDDLLEKTVPIKLDLQGNTKSGYLLSPPTITPTDALVSGCAQYINAITSVHAKVAINNADKDITSTLLLQAVDANGNNVSNVATMKPKYVNVIVPINRTKTVSIAIKTKDNLNKGLKLKSIVATPDRIDISGDSSIAGLTSINTEQVDLSSLTDSGTINTKLVLPSGVKLLNSNGTVSLRVTVEKIVQKNISLTIQTKNLDSSFTSTLDQTNVKVVISGLESDINAIRPEDVTASVDLTSAVVGDNLVNVNVTVPDGITVVSQDISNVNVKLKKS
jgi:YbbR domain-containing protein